MDQYLCNTKNPGYEYVDQMLVDVYTAGGRVFGDYMRNVLARDLFERERLSYNVVSVWFSSISAYERFVMINDGAVRPKNGPLKVEWVPDYKYQIVRGDLYHNGVAICPVEMVISPSTIPSSLFDIDNLVMGVDIEDEFPTPKLFAVNGYNLDHLLRSYECKVAMVIGPATIDDVDRMEGDGWKVIDREGMIIGSTIPTFEGLTSYEIDML